MERVIPVAAGANTIFLNFDNTPGGASSASCGATLQAVFTGGQPM